ncbi:unnamed protein product [Closterium sp. Naga37s-1]|nr:unnamed protein product [Closterium sp. Naga37s-1]
MQHSRSYPLVTGHVPVTHPALPAPAATCNPSLLPLRPPPLQLIHVYLACSTVVLILWSLGVSQSLIMHCLHQQLLRARTTLLELKKHALDSMEEVEEEEAAAGEECEPWDEQELETWIQFLERVLRENRREHEEGSERVGSTDGVGAGMSSGVARSEEEKDGALRGDREGWADTGGHSDDIEAGVADGGNEVERMKGDVERMKGDVERLRNEVAGRARVEEERARDISGLRREVEGLKSCSGDASKCLDELRAEMKAEMAVLVAQILGEDYAIGKLTIDYRSVKMGAP